MNIKTNLLKAYVSDYICNQITDFEIDEKAIIKTASEKILEEILGVIVNNKHSDFEKVEEIVKIFENSGIACGGCHDF